MNKKYFKENPTIDGVFATTDIIAIGAMKALKELNIKIGRASCRERE